MADAIRDEDFVLVDGDLAVPLSVAGPLCGLSVVSAYNHLARGLLTDVSPPGATAKVSISQINEHRTRPVTFADLGRALATKTGRYARLEAGRRRKRRST
jgi:hypothetical protein